MSVLLCVFFSFSNKSPPILSSPVYSYYRSGTEMLRMANGMYIFIHVYKFKLKSDYFYFEAKGPVSKF